MTEQKAIRPDFFIKNMPTLVADDKAAKKGADEEERQLYAMAQTGGWKVFSEYLERVMDDLDNMNNVAIEQGMGFDMIGQNTVVVNASKGIIKRMMNKVNDAIEACQNEEK